jgi:hypothetical protein
VRIGLFADKMVWLLIAALSDTFYAFLDVNVAFSWFNSLFIGLFLLMYMRYRYGYVLFIIFL